MKACQGGEEDQATKAVLACADLKAHLDWPECLDLE